MGTQKTFVFRGYFTHIFRVWNLHCSFVLGSKAREFLNTYIFVVHSKGIPLIAILAILFKTIFTEIRGLMRSIETYWTMIVSNLFLNPCFWLQYKTFAFRVVVGKGTRWAHTSVKWSYNPYKWPHKWITGIIWVITLFITGRAPPLVVWIPIMTKLKDGKLTSHACTALHDHAVLVNPSLRRKLLKEVIHPNKVV